MKINKDVLRKMVRECIEEAEGIAIPKDTRRMSDEEKCDWVEKAIKGVVNYKELPRDLYKMYMQIVNSRELRDNPNMPVSKIYQIIKRNQARQAALADEYAENDFYSQFAFESVSDKRIAEIIRECVNKHLNEDDIEEGGLKNKLKKAAKVAGAVGAIAAPEAIFNSGELRDPQYTYHDPFAQEVTTDSVDNDFEGDINDPDSMEYKLYEAIKKRLSALMK
jgi:hypothetical protein